MRTIKPVGERRIVSLAEAIQRVQNYKLPKSKAPEHSKQFLNGVVEYPISDELYTFDDNLDLLKREGFERNMSPSEYFSILSDYYADNELKAEDIVKSMLSQGEQWLSYAIMWDEELHLYQDPRGIYWAIDEYYLNGLEFFKEYTYPLPDFKLFRKTPEDLLHRQMLDPELVRHIYGPKSLSPEIQKNGGPYLRLPPRGRVWPIAVKVAENGVFLHANQKQARSRGVKINK